MVPGCCQSRHLRLTNDLDVNAVPAVEQVLGAEHPHTLVTREDLVYWTGRAGDAAGAQEQFTVLLQIRERVLAIHHRQFPSDGTLPVGKIDPCCTYDALTFAEIAELAVWADAMQDPSTMRVKIQVHYRTPAGG